MPATYSWKNYPAKIAIAEPYTRSDRKRTPVCAVIRIGKFMELAWRTYPVFDATHSHRKSQRPLYQTESTVSPVTGSHPGHHSRTKCPWRASIATNAISLMRALNQQMVTVSAATPVKCWQPRLYMPPPNIAKHAISLIVGAHRADTCAASISLFFLFF